MCYLFFDSISLAVKIGQDTIKTGRKKRPGGEKKQRSLHSLIITAFAEERGHLLPSLFFPSSSLCLLAPFCFPFAWLLMLLL
jgi:hypothetical protein